MNLKDFAALSLFRLALDPDSKHSNVCVAISWNQCWTNKLPSYKTKVLKLIVPIILLISKSVCWQYYITNYSLLDIIHHHLIIIIKSLCFKGQAFQCLQMSKGEGSTYHAASNRPDVSNAVSNKGLLKEGWLLQGPSIGGENRNCLLLLIRTLRWRYTIYIYHSFVFP
jgi:hypothetical protein